MGLLKQCVGNKALPPVNACILRKLRRGIHPVTAEVMEDVTDVKGKGRIYKYIEEMNRVPKEAGYFDLSGFMQRPSWMRAEATDTEEEEEEDLTLTQQLEGIMEEGMTQQEEFGERDPSAGTDWDGVWDLLKGFCFQEQATEGPVAFDGGPGGTDWEGLW